MANLLLALLPDSMALARADSEALRPAGGSDALRRVLAIIGLVWLGYFAALAGLDSWFVLSRPGTQALPAAYYLSHMLIAVLLLVLALSRLAQHRLGRAYLPMAIGCLSVLPVLVEALLLSDLPPGPIAATEGFISMRLWPMQVVGVVVAAWYYRWRSVAGYVLLITGLNLAAILLKPPISQPKIALTLLAAINLLMFGYCIAALMARLRQQGSAMAQANIQLRHYASTLERLAVTRERNRVARELHDTLAHTLSGLTVQLETIKAYAAVNPVTVAPMVETALGTARSGLDETRRALKALRASPLEDLGLRLALETLAESSAAPAGLRLSLRIDDPPPCLAPDAEQALYRIAQEAIANAVQHAAARSLTVRLSAESQTVTLLVQDDGRGFDLRQPGAAGHFGLAGMHERAALAGGSLTVSSAPGQGTTVEAMCIL